MPWHLNPAEDEDEDEGGDYRMPEVEDKDFLDVLREKIVEVLSSIDEEQEDEDEEDDEEEDISD